jgi:hypothetical protein
MQQLDRSWDVPVSSERPKVLSGRSWNCNILSQNLMPRTSPGSDPITTNIIYKWNKQGFFVRFVNKNTLDLRDENLQVVSIREAMEHIDDWKVDWDATLTAAEIALVRTAKWRAGLFFPKKKAT